MNSGRGIDPYDDYKTTSTTQNKKKENAPQPPPSTTTAVMTHRFSHCSTNGHNSRTCTAGNHQGNIGNGPNGCEANGPGSGGRGRGEGGSGALGGVKLFGVRLTEGSTIKKSASMGNLSNHFHSIHGGHGSGSRHNENPSASPTSPVAAAADGYLSDDPAHHGPDTAARRGDRKKGVPWTEEEHRMFLIGLQKLGKGDWRGISRHYVTSRTPTQVASHAQKYFIRQSSTGRRKRRSSLFDMPQDMADNTHPVHEDVTLTRHYEFETEVLNFMPSLDLSLGNISSSMHVETPRDNTLNIRRQATVPPSIGFSSVIPGYIPVPSPLCPVQLVSPPLCDNTSSETSSLYGFVKPTPLLAKQPVNLDKLVSISQLSLVERENSCGKSTSTLSLKLLNEPLRHSMFHA